MRGGRFADWGSCGTVWGGNGNQGEEMKKIWPVVLILGGEAILEMQAQEEKQREEAARLMATVLPTPGSCADVTTGIVFAICEGETEDGAPLPDWTAMASPGEQACILDAFHQTNAHAYRIRREDYDGAAPDDVRVKTFVIDLCEAILWSDGIGWGDTHSPLPALIDAFYADRAESRFAPKRSY